MNDLQRSVKPQKPPSTSRLSFTRTGRKVAIYLLAGVIVLVMIVWFGFLGWGAVTMLQGLLDCIKSFWSATHF
jgi:hypothetical protein